MAERTRLCTRCGESLRPTANHCPKCNFDVSGVASQPPPAAQSGSTPTVPVGTPGTPGTPGTAAPIAEQPSRTPNFCPSCGKETVPSSDFCNQCGASLAQRPSPGAVTPSGTPSGTPGRYDVPNYLVQSILVTIFCCLPLGIAAIVFAAQVNGKLASGDHAGAVKTSGTAKTLCWIAFGLGIAVILLYITCAAVVAV